MNTQKVIDMYLIRESSAYNFNKKLKEYINKGYQPEGKFKYSPNYYYQMMYKYEE